MPAIGSLKNRWIPKSWEPLYEQMTLLSAAGVTNLELASRFKYTPQQVSNILNTPQAKIIKKMLTDKLRSEMKATFETQTTELADVALENVSTVLKDKALLEKNPFAMMRASMEFMKGVGKLEGDKPAGGMNVQNNNFIMSDKAAERMAEALARSVEIKQLHGDPLADVKQLPPSTVIEDDKKSA